MLNPTKNRQTSVLFFFFFFFFFFCNIQFPKLCFAYSLVQWNWFSDVTGCTWVICIHCDVREPISLHQAVHVQVQTLQNTANLYVRPVFVYLK